SLADALSRHIWLVLGALKSPNNAMNRREFIGRTALATTAVAVGPIASAAAEARDGGSPRWPIGCFNRPWAEKKKWEYEVALTGIKEAGYHLTGLLSRSAKEPLIGSDATPEYLTRLKERIAAHGLKANMGALRTKNDL